MQVGIRHGYPRLPVSRKLAAYVATARPFTLLAPLVGTVAAAGLAVKTGYIEWDALGAEWRRLVFGAATLIMVVIGSNFVNQALDPEDQVNRPWRPVVQRLVTPDEATTLGHLMWFAAILRAATMSVAFGAITVLLVALAYLYSHQPVRLKARPWMGNVGIALARGHLGFLAAWTLWAPWTAPEAWAAGFIMFVFLLGATTAKDYGDAKGDAAHGVKNLVVQYGARNATLLSLPFVLSPPALITIADVHALLQVGTLSFLAVCACVIVLAHHMWRSHDQANRFLEGGRPWAWMYMSLLALQIAFAAPF